MVVIEQVRHQETFCENDAFMFVGAVRDGGAMPGCPGCTTCTSSDGLCCEDFGEFQVELGGLVSFFMYNPLFLWHLFRQLPRLEFELAVFRWNFLSQMQWSNGPVYVNSLTCCRSDKNTYYYRWSPAVLRQRWSWVYIPSILHGISKPSSIEILCTDSASCSTAV